MYASYYGFDERPFSLLPDPRYLYWSKAHSQAFAMLEYGLMTGAPITVITGEIGAGKTTLLRHLLNQITDEHRVGLISNAQGDRGELLHWVLMALGQEVSEDRSYVQLFHQLQTYLVEEYATGRRTILIFDEAQNLSVETLEELRMFSNVNADTDVLLQIILTGQPELCDKIAQPGLVQFAQRIAAQFHLPRLTLPETRAYIQHRLAVAGAMHRIFAPRAERLIHMATEGAPRLINLLCDFALVHGFSKEMRLITPGVIQQVTPHLTRYGAFKDISDVKFSSGKQVTGPAKPHRTPDIKIVSRSSDKS